MSLALVSHSHCFRRGVYAHRHALVLPRRPHNKMYYKFNILAYILISLMKARHVLPRCPSQADTPAHTHDRYSQHTIATHNHSRVHACARAHTHTHTHTHTQHSPSGSADPTCSNDFFKILWIFNARNSEIHIYFSLQQQDEPQATRHHHRAQRLATLEVFVLKFSQLANVLGQ
jgi:hypothetical protein